MNTTDGTTYGSASLKTNITGDTINFAKLPQVNGTNLVLSSDLSGYIPQGGTLTAPLKVTGGDQATSGKIILDQSNRGQITNTGTGTLFGFNDSATLSIGHANYNMSLRGKGARPKYQNKDMAFYEDIPSKVDANNPNIFIGYSGAENANSFYQVAFKDNDQANGICWSRFANISNGAAVNGVSTSRTPSGCTDNGFYYVTSSTNSLSGADANPFLQYHTSNNDFRILTTAYSDQWLQQIATDFRSDHIYYRRRENGTWTTWTKIGGGSGLSLNNWQITESSSKLVFSLK
jgi:hypothetical protein